MFTTMGVLGLGCTAIKGLVAGVGLAVIAAAAQAQTADERVLNPSHENPSLTVALRNWLASKTGDKTTAEKKTLERKTVERAQPVTRTAETHRHRYRVHHYRVPETAAPKTATIAPATIPAAPAAAPARSLEAPAVAAPAFTASTTPAVPPHATTAAPAMTVSAAPTTTPEPVRTYEDLNMPRAVATITVVRPSAPRPHHGRSHCTTGEYIITAFYWEGRHTASGARFNPEGMTAAHRTLPFGTRLLVINPRNGKSVTVTVNDRGPFTRGVTLDLSRGAAKAIGLQGNAAVCMAKI
jgi:rare lipoprotein A